MVMTGKQKMLQRIRRRQKQILWGGVNQISNFRGNWSEVHLMGECGPIIVPSKVHGNDAIISTEECIKFSHCLCQSSYM